MIYGIILDAGNQTRFDDDLPKSLQKVKGKTVLERNIMILNQVVDNYYIVVNLKKKDYFNHYAENRIVIKSGLGSGDAVYHICKNLKLNNDDKVVLIWGDSIHTSTSVIHRGLAKLNEVDFSVPVYQEKDPYVRFVIGEDASIAEILFSKYSGPNEYGYHDQSCFFFRVGALMPSLEEIRFQFYDYSRKKYLIPDREDFDLLEIFNICNNIPKNLMFNVKKSEKSFSFNTIEELQLIEEKI